jgi:hypothetical protein
VGTKEETVKMASRFFMVPIEILLEMKYLVTERSYLIMLYSLFFLFYYSPVELTGGWTTAPGASHSRSGRGSWNETTTTRHAGCMQEEILHPRRERSR